MLATLKLSVLSAKRLDSTTLIETRMMRLQKPNSRKFKKPMTPLAQPKNAMSTNSSSECRACSEVEEVHAVIRHGTDGEWYLSDCGSKSGTMLLLEDGGVQLDVGDVVTIGNTELGMYVKRRG